MSKVNLDTQGARQTITVISALVLSLTTISCAKETVPVTSNHYGDSTMAKKICVGYATRAGSTREVADSIGKTLAETGVQVDVRPIKEIKSIEGYDAIVLGTAIRAGQLMPEVVKFAKVHKAALGKVPVAVFVVCLTMKDDTPENRKIVSGYLDPLQKEISFAATGLFAGKMDYSTLNFFLKFIVKKMVKAPEGDFRDWKKVRAWAGELFRAEDKK
jgi:menaquinone-dependent protoporphyrinogen oxidase